MYAAMTPLMIRLAIATATRRGSMYTISLREMELHRPPK